MRANPTGRAALRSLSEYLKGESPDNFTLSDARARLEKESPHAI